MSKCICKKCENCRLYLTWDMENKDGIRNQMKKCALIVMAEEIPKIRGAIDGCQTSSNETRNRVLEFGHAAVETLRNMPKLLQ